MQGAKTPKPATASIEALENRRLMTATLARGVLTIEGTDTADTFYLFQTFDDQTGRPDRVHVQREPDPAPGAIELVTQQTFPAGSVRRIVVRAGGGDDTVNLGYMGMPTFPQTRVPVSARSVLDGGDGNDFLVGGDGRDLITGGAGDDYHAGYGGNDTIICGDGDDTVVVSGGRETVFGGAGNDFINAGGDHPGAALGLFADGGDGDDRITGSRKRDRLAGGAGNDQIGSGGGPRDRVLGGDGDDLLDANADPTAVLVGGRGRDTFGVTEEARPRIKDFDPDEDELSFPVRVIDPIEEPQSA